MRYNRWAETVGALLLIGGGLSFLLSNLGVLTDLVPLFWAGVFLAGGLLFLAAFLAGHEHWWTLIAGSALGGTGLTVLLSGSLFVRGEIGAAALFLCLAAGFGGVYLVDRRANWWAMIPGGVMAMMTVMVLASVAGGFLAGAVFFVGLGAIFASLYFVEINGQRGNWWALIPAGALLSLAAVVILSEFAPGSVAAAALFLGLGLTFGLLYLLRGPARPTEWAWIPAVALLAFGIFVPAVSGESRVAQLFWPLALVIGGVVLFLRNWNGRRAGNGRISAAGRTDTPARTERP